MKLLAELSKARWGSPSSLYHITYEYFLVFVQLENFYNLF